MLESHQWKGVKKKHVFIIHHLLYLVKVICIDQLWLLPQSELLCSYYISVIFNPGKHPPFIPLLTNKSYITTNSYTHLKTHIMTPTQFNTSHTSHNTCACNYSQTYTFQWIENQTQC